MRLRIIKAALKIVNESFDGIKILENHLASQHEDQIEEGAISNQ